MTHASRDSQHAVCLAPAPNAPALHPADLERDSFEADTTRPSWARLLNYWLGDKDHYPVDRDFGAGIIDEYPQISVAVRHHQWFQTRVVRYLAGTARIRQFLVIGTDFPVEAWESVHETAQRIAPESRVVYVDSDRLVMAYARALLRSGPAGRCGHVETDLSDVAAILDGAALTLDLGLPVAVLVPWRLDQIPSDHDAASFVRDLSHAVPAGSRFVVTHPTDGMAGALMEFAAASGQDVVARSPQQVRALLDGLEPVEPGVVPVSLWRPNPSHWGQPKVDVCCALAVKP